MGEVSTPQNSLAVAVCQLTSIDDLETNCERILELLHQLEDNPPDLICFPENSLYLRVQEGDSIPGLSLSNRVFTRLADWAQAFGAVIHLGSVPLLQGGGLYNSSVLIRENGEVHAAYQKMHLFDVDVEGHRPVRESDVFAHGAGPVTFEVNGWRLGSSICYDLRFPELFLHYAKAGVDAILVPSAFLVPTGRDHWAVLTRARAIESQAYVLAAAQGGRHEGIRGGVRFTYGHSMIIDPWGVVLQELPTEADNGRIIRAELSKDRIQQVRKQIPVSSHRRLK